MQPSPAPVSPDATREAPTSAVDGGRAQWDENWLAEGRRRKRRAWLMLLAGIACAAVVLASDAFLLFLALVLHDKPLLNLVFVVGLALGGGVFAWRLIDAWWTCGKIRRLVPQTGAAVCPRCVRALENQRSLRVCPKCGDFFDQEWLDDYWLMWAVHPPSARRLLVARPAPPPRTWLGRLLTGNARWGVIAASIVALVLLAGWNENTSLVGAALRIAPMLGAGFAWGSILTVWLRMRRPADVEPRCRRCGYLRGPKEQQPNCCPECGLPWSRESFILGQPEQPFWKAMLGAGALAIVAFLLFTSGFDWNPVAKILIRLEPTSALITDVTAGGFARRWREWDELRRRTLSKSQRERLAAGLLDRRKRTGKLDGQESAWLRRCVLAGPLPDDLVERYYREGFTIEIVPSQPIRVGREVSLTIRGRLAFDLGRPASLEDVFTLEAVYVDDSLVETDFQAGLMQYAELLDMPHYEIHAAWKPQRAGPHTVRATGWYAVGTSLASRIARVWRAADHRPVLPPENIERMLRVEAVATINVEP